MTWKICHRTCIPGVMQFGVDWIILIRNADKLFYYIAVYQPILRGPERSPEVIIAELSVTSKYEIGEGRTQRQDAQESLFEQKTR